MYQERKGYLLIRKSREGWYPHFLWMSEGNEIHHFQPTERKIYKYCPPLIFEGYVKIGDEKQKAPDESRA
jgi:hypothetical protein